MLLRSFQNVSHSSVVTYETYEKIENREIIVIMLPEIQCGYLRELRDGKPRKYCHSHHPSAAYLLIAKMVDIAVRQRF